MSKEALELRFDPKTIEHLGVKMYSTLPPALAELISNSYDADASEVSIEFYEQNGSPVSITVKDDGTGMSYDEIQSKFLVIGRNRRQDDGDKPSQKYNRLPTGKKGLGKLALFGLANLITVDTLKNSKRNRFQLDWDNLLTAEGVYKPKIDLIDDVNHRKTSSGTTIKLSNLKRKTPFDLEAIADSLSKIFIVDSNFTITLKKAGTNTEIVIDNSRRYKNLKKEFEWKNIDLISEADEYFKKIKLNLITAETPIPPSSGFRGVTIFSRGKLVNNPEYFSESTSSHFYQYLTGWIEADFIDLVNEDVISTNRQSINWDHDEMKKFRDFLSKIISKVSNSWRIKRQEKKDTTFIAKTGINKEKWLSTLPTDIKKSAEKIISTLITDEGVSENFTPIVQALHNIIPEYPMLHWRHLNEELAKRVKIFYENKQYGLAADQGTKVYAELARKVSGEQVDGVRVANIFGGNPPKILLADLSTESGQNIQEGQGHLTRGLMTGFRNPINHAPIDTVVPSTFSELDCLNILSLVSYLMTKVDNKIETNGS
jgi:uncharacterized protein (TIGR02391 family)